MSQQRSYRKKISTSGLIYMGGKEHGIAIENISISGLLAEFKDNQAFHNTEEIFEVLRPSPLIDMYIPEMKVAGLAEVVWVDIADGKIRIALEFKSLSYEVSDVIYRRRAYRKIMTGPGLISFNGEEHLFNTENVSVEGLMIRVMAKINVDIGTVAQFSFEPLHLQGTVKVVWLEHCESSTVMGLCYERLEKGHIESAIPRFYS